MTRRHGIATGNVGERAGGARRPHSRTRAAPGAPSRRRQHEPGRSCRDLDRMAEGTCDRGPKTARVPSVPMRFWRGGAVAVLAVALVCVVPVTAGAGPKQCPSGQFDRGGECTRYVDAVREIVAVTRSVMAESDAKAVILRVDVGDRTVVNRGLGISMAGTPGELEDEVPSRRDGDPAADDDRPPVAGHRTPQPRRHALGVVPELPERRSRHVAHARQRDVGLSGLHPGEPAVPGRPAGGTLPSMDRRRAARVRVRTAGGL